MYRVLTDYLKTSSSGQIDGERVNYLDHVLLKQSFMSTGVVFAILLVPMSVGLAS